MKSTNNLLKPPWQEATAWPIKQNKKNPPANQSIFREFEHKSIKFLNHQPKQSNFTRFSIWGTQPFSINLLLHKTYTSFLDPLVSVPIQKPYIRCKNNCNFKSYKAEYIYTEKIVTKDTNPQLHYWSHKAWLKTMSILNQQEGK